LINDFALPAGVSRAVACWNYSGYAVKSGEDFKVVVKRTNKEYMEVIVAKASDTKKLYFDTRGNLIKESNNAKGQQSRRSSQA
jgi:hypothetical protein